MPYTLVVALGSLRYQVERPFGRWQEGAGRVTGVAHSRRGVHVLLREDPLHDTRGPRVLTLDGVTGAPLAAWGADVIADAHLIAAYGDRLYIVDRDAHQVIVATLDGEVRSRLGERNRPLEPFNHPTDVAVAPDGTVYVSDGYAGASVHRFAPDGAPLARWGRWGTGPGEFVNPHAIWVMRDGRVVVADRENGRLQVFDPEGTLLTIWTGFVRPAALWGDVGDRLYVVDAVPTLTRLAPDGALMGRCRPVLNGAHGIWGDEGGRLYLAEGNPSRVTRLVPIEGAQA
ncbi:hypothetical protein [Methylobacterium sp. J-077]|uniref:hypothetical protein n=1 Tax=Methylobacterium sp. J-077 TaxID=2836656 RepID=UPI001FBB94DA|nr:hypothetical protein [Methylobacterium sp. J-077]MCJ2124012.1 hypothetical protein [Methylobacterium sp. J-077]